MHSACHLAVTSLVFCSFRCTADGVYLQPLADKFARLVLQLLARYAFWLTEGIAPRSDSGTSTPPQQGSDTDKVCWQAATLDRAAGMVTCSLLPGHLVLADMRQGYSWPTQLCCIMS